MRTITLPDRCDRAAAEALLPEFQAALGSGVVRIDASNAQHIGQAMLQILISARLSAEGATIIASPALAETAKLIGLAPVLFDAPRHDGPASDVATVAPAPTGAA